MCAIFRVPRDDPVNADFDAALDGVNALADAAPGFVWRMIGEGESDGSGHHHQHDGVGEHRAAGGVRLSQCNASRCDAAEEGMVRRDAGLPRAVVGAGREISTLSEERAKLELIGRLGPTEEAFDFKNAFAPPD